MPVTCADMPLFSTYASAPLTPSALFNLDAAAASTYPPLSNTDAKMGQDINPFNMTFATMAGIDVTAANAYTNSNPQVRYPMATSSAPLPPFYVMAQRSRAHSTHAPL